MKKLLVVMTLFVCLYIGMGIATQAAEVTGNNWIMPVSNYTSIGCRWACYCTDKNGKVIHDGDHPGNDIRAKKNTMILAARSGIVVEHRDSCNGSHWSSLNECACKKGRWSGNYVKIQHTNGKYTVYYHMNVACVRTGDWVDQGDIIGYIGRTGNASGYHTCFEYHNSSDKATSYVDDIVDNAKAGANGSTKYLMTLRTTNKNIGIYEKPSVKSTRLGTVEKGEEVLCRIIQENYGFVEHNGVSGWILMKGNTTKKEDAFQLDYYKNNGKGKMSNTTHVAGTDITLPNNTFEREGYIFAGWKIYRPYDRKWFYKNHDGTKWGWYVYEGAPEGWSRAMFYDGAVIPGEWFENISGRQVLRMTAIWVDEDAINYTVKYLPEGGSGTMADTEGTKGIADPITVCKFSMDEYVFAGWTASRESDGKWLYRNAEGSAKWCLPGEEPEGYSIGRFIDGGITISPTTVDGDIIYLYAQWTKDGILWLQPENGNDSYTKYIGDELTVGELPIPKKLGYHFVGWFTQQHGGEQVVSLTNVDDISGNTLYAHWVSHDERPFSDGYMELSSDENQYVLALSQMLVASGQQPDSFNAEKCYEYLDSVGMISEKGNVFNQRFTTSGFLEYYAPELTWYGESYVCDSYDEYVAKLSQMADSGYYIMVKLDIDGTNTVWRYLYEANGESLVIVHNGELTDVKDVAEGLVSSNLFMYHGTYYSESSSSMGGIYEFTEQVENSIKVLLDYSASGLESGVEYKMWVAYYSEEDELLSCKEQTVKFDSEMNAEFTVECPEVFEECRVYAMESDMKPMCEAVTLECSN